MYKITLVTEDVRVNSKTWENDLFNDFHKAINNKSWTYKSLGATIEKIKGLSNKSIKRLYNGKNNYIRLNGVSYGKQLLKIGLYGLTLGYIDIEKRLSNINDQKIVNIPLNHFYDIRQGNKAIHKALKNGYIKIELL